LIHIDIKEYLYIDTDIDVYVRTVPASHSLHEVKGATDVVRAAQRLHAARPWNGW